MAGELNRDNPNLNWQAKLRTRLELGPWCWPTGGIELQRARNITAMPSVSPGATILVTTNQNQASVWAFRSGSKPAGAYLSSFGRESAVSWRRAALALPRSLPVLWRSVETVRRQQLEACWLDTWLWGTRLRPEPSLDGESFGLAFLLSVASAALKVPLPVDLVGLASVDANGWVGVVGDLPTKIEALGRLAPRVRRVLVSSRQKDLGQAREAGVDFGIEVLATSHGTEALAEAFEASKIAQALVAEADDSGSRREFVEALFELVLKGRGEVPEWGPVHAAARLVRESPESGASLSVVESRQLEYAEAVAARHMNNEGELPLPDEEWLSSLPVPIRLITVANLVQQAADTATPNPDATETFASRFCAHGTEAFGEHLVLQGALGRLKAVCGEPHRALELQEEAAVGFADRLKGSEASRPLAEWLRLSGVVQDAVAFDRAVEFRHRLEAVGDVSHGDEPYLDLAWAKGRVLGVGTGDPELTLRRLIEPDSHYHVGFSAVRWLVRWLDSDKRATDADHHLHRLDEEGRDQVSQRGKIAARYAALIRLDRALSQGDSDGARAASKIVERLQYGLWRNITRGRNDPESNRQLALLFPY
jgi:hypothetical protein